MELSLLADNKWKAGLVLLTVSRTPLDSG